FRSLHVTNYSHSRNSIAIRVVQYTAMDIDALHSTLLSITMVSNKLLAGREVTPQLENLAPGFGDLLTEAERDLRMATATLAGELGFSLCPRCWPPELVT